MPALSAAATSARRSEGVRHLEAETRGSNVPIEDVFTSYWPYQRWLRGGDPYFSPNLSQMSTQPRLRGPGEPEPMKVVGEILDREFTVFPPTFG